MMQSSSQLVMRLNGSDAAEGMFDLVFGKTEGALRVVGLWVCDIYIECAATITCMKNIYMMYTKSIYMMYIKSTHTYLMMMMMIMRYIIPTKTQR